MLWIESIDLRTARATASAKVFELCRQAFHSFLAEKLLKLTVYSSARYAGDISVCLEWESDPGAESAIGRAIHGELRNMGLISHTVWKQEEEFSALASDNLRELARQPLSDSEQRILSLQHTLPVLSHDIRGLLQSLAAGLDLLLRGKFGTVDKKITYKLTRLRSQAVRLNGIAEDFLIGITFDESGEIRKEALDLRKAVIDPVLEEFADLIQSGRIRIEDGKGAVPAKAVTVRASGRLLRSVYRNLLSNAVRYGGSGCTVFFGCEDQGRSYRLNVSNSGEPVPEELRDKLFTRFGCIGRISGNATDGTGLGLYLVREIIRRHGGDIWYEAGQSGSNFVFTVPKEEKYSLCRDDRKARVDGYPTRIRIQDDHKAAGRRRPRRTR